MNISPHALARMLAAFTLGLLATACSHKQSDGAAAPSDEVATFVGRARSCSRLYTTEYVLRKIVVFDDEVRLKGNVLNRQVNVKISVGNRKVAIPMSVTLKGYVDLSGFTARNVERTATGLVVTLPDPQVVVSSTRIDTRGIKQVVSLTRRDFTPQELEALERQGVDSIKAHIGETGIVEQTRTDVARTLWPLLTQLGYRDEQIEVRFRDDLGRELPPEAVHIEKVNENPHTP